MSTTPQTQKDRALELLGTAGMARLSEFRRAGITAATVARLEREGAVVRLGRGLYQRPDAPLDVHHTLAEAAKRVPKGVVCLLSALAFHDLTDRTPAQVWMAIGRKDWRPRIDHPPLRIVRFGPGLIETGIEEHAVESVRVRIYGPAKTIVDLFRYRRVLGLNPAIEGLRGALRRQAATPADIAGLAAEARVWPLVQPYIEALTADG